MRNIRLMTFFISSSLAFYSVTASRVFINLETMRVKVRGWDVNGGHYKKFWEELASLHSFKCFQLYKEARRNYKLIFIQMSDIFMLEISPSIHSHTGTFLT
jgi:hypothetical protein